MPTPTVERLSRLMIEAGRLIRTRLQGPEGAVGLLSYLQIATLGCVHESPEPPLMKEVATRLRVTPPSMTPVIESLTAAGLLRRRPDRKDRRAARLHLTPEGRRILAAARRAHAEKMRAILSVLGPEDRGSLARILERLVREFRA